MKDIYYALFNKHEDNIKEETKKFICEYITKNQKNLFAK